MRTVRLVLSAALISLLGSAASAQDAMGGFDKPYTNAGNVFGKGAWGDGSGTALPLPGGGYEYGMYYDQAYSAGSNLFGSGFWTSEYMVRRAEGAGRPRAWSGEAVYDGGPLGKSYAGAEGHGGTDGKGHGKDKGKGHSKDKGHGKDKGKGHDKGHGKGGGKHDKPHKPKPPKHEVKYKEKIRYIPYERTERVVVMRRSASVVVMEKTRSSELGQLNVTYRPRSAQLAAVCIDGKGNEHPAIRVSEAESGHDYDGEIFRCVGDRMLRVSFATGSADVAGSVRTADGSSYKDCDGGDALVRTRDGELTCRSKRPMAAAAERRLEAEADTVSYAYAEAGRGLDLSPGAIDISGMELSGGVGN